jgi:hypothetical protein
MWFEKSTGGCKKIHIMVFSAQLSIRRNLVLHSFSLKNAACLYAVHKHLFFALVLGKLWKVIMPCSGAQENPTLLSREEYHKQLLRNHLLLVKHVLRLERTMPVRSGTTHVFISSHNKNFTCYGDP